MATVSSLVDQLKALASIQASELFAAGDLNSYMIAALRQHDKNMSAATLPVSEEEPVITLAWIKVCYVRASRYSSQPNVNGASGYGQDRNSPYNKNMDLAKNLMKRYTELVTDLGIEHGGAGVSVGNLIVKDLSFDGLVPLIANPNIPPLLLAETDFGETFSVLDWTFDTFDNFREFLLFHLIGDAPIFQEWNFNSSVGTPKISDNAKKVFSTLDYRATAVKITDLDKTLVNRFLLVVRSRSENFGYSNEITLQSIIGMTGIQGAEGEVVVGAEGGVIEGSES